MDERILTYLKDKHIWKNLGDLIGGQILALQDYKKNMNKSWQKFKSDGISETEIKTWVKEKQQIVSKKENFIDIVREAYSYLDAHLGDAIEVRRRVKKLTDLLQNKVLVKGKLPKELMEDQHKALQKVVNDLIKISKESEEITKKTKHII